MSDPIYLERLIGMLEPFDGKPRAQNVMKAPETHVVVFEFAAGQELHEHRAQHPVLIQALSGHLRLSHDDGSFELRPGDVLYLPSMLRHEVVALEDSTLTVTMLLGRVEE